MTVRVHGSPVTHVLDRVDADRRLAWTRCGLRFAWGRTPGGRPSGRCPECAA